MNMIYFFNMFSSGISDEDPGQQIKTIIIISDVFVD